MIYAYLSDEAFAVTGTGSVLNFTDVGVQQYGIPTDKVLNYFDTVLKKGSTTEYLVQHGMILDPVYEGDSAVGESEHRTDRLIIDSANSTYRPTGGMTLHFDRAKLTDANDLQFIDAITISTTEAGQETIRKAKNDKRAQLFNIIEAIYMAHHPSTEGSRPYTKEELEDVFETAPTRYKGYVVGSMKLSATVSTVSYRYAYLNGTKIVVANAPQHDFYDHFEFQFKYGDTSADIITIKIWLNNSLFLGDYPYSTIIDVLYPCNPC